MKPFLFITDFDGTVTAQDFVYQIMYRYQHDKIFSKNKKRGVELLSSVFYELRLTQEEFLKEIEYIPMDKTFVPFFEFINKSGGDVLVLSAGAKYYIKKKFSFEGIKNIEIFANDLVFKNNHFRFLTNEDKRFFCPVFGIDKEKVVASYKEKYEKIFYAGDSYVDFYAAKLSDFIFAKKNLVRILKMFNLEFFEFENFDDVRENLINLI